MLVLGRKVGERLVIGGEVFVTVVAVRGSQVRLGIEAPAKVAVQREELCSPGEIEPISTIRRKRPARIPR